MDAIAIEPIGVATGNLNRQGAGKCQLAKALLGELRYVAKALEITLG